MFERDWPQNKTKKGEKRTFPLEYNKPWVLVTRVSWFKYLEKFDQDFLLINYFGYGIYNLEMNPSSINIKIHV